MMNPDGSNVVELVPDRTVDKDGKLAGASLYRREVGSWSPDGKKLLFYSSEKAYGTDILNVITVDDPSNIVQLTVASGGTVDTAFNNPRWSPNGKKIAFLSNRQTANEIYVMNADGSNITQITHLAQTKTDPRDYGLSWSPDGKKIAFVVNIDRDKPNDFDIVVMNADGSNIVDLTSNTPNTDEFYPSWSPDGKKIAFAIATHGTGALQTFVMNKDGSNVVPFTDFLGASHPGWSPDGSKIVVSAYQHDMTVMNADGSNRITINTFGSEGAAIWSPR